MQDKATLPEADDYAAARSDGLTPAEVATQRKLKAIVLGLGVLIMLAFAGVIAGMVYRASQIGKGPTAKPPLSPAPPMPGTQSGIPVGDQARRPALPFMPDIKLKLAPGSTVKSTALHGTSLVVYHEGPAGAGIVILDLTSGQVVSRVTLDVAQGQ